MKIRAIKPGHITMCSWCKADNLKTQAVYHLTGANKQSCAFHKSELEAIKADAEKLNKQEPSEADHQTWMKL